jgi:hypothetical protein
VTPWLQLLASLTLAMAVTPTTVRPLLQQLVSPRALQGNHPEDGTRVDCSLLRRSDVSRLSEKGLSPTRCSKTKAHKEVPLL